MLPCRSGHRLRAVQICRGAKRKENGKALCSSLRAVQICRGAKPLADQRVQPFV